jgi:hypothetical protein
VGGTMKSLTQAQEATGRAHITIQVLGTALFNLLHFLACSKIQLLRGLNIYH